MQKGDGSRKLKMNYKEIIKNNLSKDLIHDKPFIRFLFENNKVLYEVEITTKPNEEDFKYINKLFKHIRTHFNFKPKLTIRYSKSKSGDQHYLEIYKSKLKFGRDYHRDHGIYFNIPKCCMKKYLIEQKGKKYISYYSAKRYLEQCRKIGIKKDVFNISVLHGSADCSKYGFIPCSPNCGKALKVVEMTAKLHKKLIKSFS